MERKEKDTRLPHTRERKEEDRIGTKRKNNTRTKNNTGNSSGVVLFKDVLNMLER